MAVSTATTILKTSITEAGTYTKLVDIIDYPDTGSAPSKLDTTTLSAVKYKTNMLGLQDSPDFTFSALYDKATYLTITAMTGVKWFTLELGAAGVDGIFKWSGNISVFASAAGVDEVRKMTITISAATEPTFA